MGQDSASFGIPIRANSDKDTSIDKLKALLKGTAKYDSTRVLEQYEGWVFARLIVDTDEVDVISSFDTELNNLVDNGFPGSYFNYFVSDTGTSFCYTLYEGRVLSCLDPEQALSYFLNFEPDPKLNFFDSRKDIDRVIIRVVPNNQKITDKLEQLFIAYKNSKSDSDYKLLKDFIDTQSNQGLDETQFDYPCSHPDLPVPPNISKDLGFVYRKGNQLFLGFYYSDLSSYLDEECALYGCEEPQVTHFVDAFRGIAYNPSGKARTVQLEKQNKEIILGADDVTYFTIIPITSEAVWDEYP